MKNVKRVKLPSLIFIEPSPRPDLWRDNCSVRQANFLLSLSNSWWTVLEESSATTDVTEVNILFGNIGKTVIIPVLKNEFWVSVNKRLI